MRSFAVTKVQWLVRFSNVGYNVIDTWIACWACEAVYRRSFVRQKISQIKPLILSCQAKVDFRASPWVGPATPGWRHPQAVSWQDPGPCHLPYLHWVAKTGCTSTSSSRWWTTSLLALALRKVFPVCKESLIYIYILNELYIKYNCKILISEFWQFEKSFSFDFYRKNIMKLNA